MNVKSKDHDGSSRSHCAIILTLAQLDVESNMFTKTEFHLVDFAGAERPVKAGGTRPSAFEIFVKFMEGKPADQGDQAVLINYELFEF